MMLIGDVARHAVLRPSAIRYYERLGLLPAPIRRNGRRHYGEEVLFRLQLIRFARESGFSLREIRWLFAGKPYSTRMRQVARHKIGELEKAIERGRSMQSLLKRAIRCRCLTLEECGRRLRQATTGSKTSELRVGGGAAPLVAPTASCGRVDGSRSRT